MPKPVKLIYQKKCHELLQNALLSAGIRIMLPPCRELNDAFMKMGTLYDACPASAEEFVISDDDIPF